MYGGEQRKRKYFGQNSKVGDKILERKGLLIVVTGDGKGKTTSALGLALRAYGNGLKVLILQFIKGAQSYGELSAVEKLNGNEERIIIKQAGLGFTKRGGIDEKTHKKAADFALNEAKDALQSGDWDMVILDEILYAVKFNLIEEKELFSLIDLKDENTHLVLTGRGASDALIKKADLVSDIACVKHPYQKGIKAQAGIEF